MGVLQEGLWYQIHHKYTEISNWGFCRKVPLLSNTSQIHSTSQNFPPGGSAGRCPCYQSSPQLGSAEALDAFPKPQTSFPSPRSCGGWSRRCSQSCRCPRQWNSYTSPQTSSCPMEHQGSNGLFKNKQWYSCKEPKQNTKSSSNLKRRHCSAVQGTNWFTGKLSMWKYWWSHNHRAKLELNSEQHHSVCLVTSESVLLHLLSPKDWWDLPGWIW